ncbi:MAG: hypothetical protein JNM63_03790 [Spirochaetia bacterium]|nr:hypothetical protein [Spirochaetia bacterium]
MNKILLSLSLLCFSILSAAGVSDKLIAIINEKGSGMDVVSISAVPFPEVLKNPSALALKDGVLTYKGKPDAKGAAVEFDRCFPLVPVVVVITEATDSKGVVVKTMTITTALEGAVPATGHVASCSKTLEGLISGRQAQVTGTGVVTFSAGALFVSKKEKFKVTFVDGLCTAEGENVNGDLKTTVYAPSYISKVDLVADDKGNKSVGIFGGLNLAPVKIPDGKKLF